MIEQDKRKLIEIVFKYLPKARIFLYGSRARNDHTAESDIDIAIDNKSKIDKIMLSTIKEDVDESTIPFFVDIVDFAEVSDDLRNQILKDGILW
jgi:uncharacterized protein